MIPVAMFLGGLAVEYVYIHRLALAAIVQICALWVSDRIPDKKFVRAFRPHSGRHLHDGPLVVARPAPRRDPEVEVAA